MVKMNQTLGALVLSVVSIVAATPLATADELAAPINSAAAGTIVGVVTNAAKAPVGGATVTAVRAGGGIRSTISGSDGVYSFADVAPGSWSLTTTVDGFPDVTLPAVTVVAGKPARRDVVMNVPASTAPAPAVALA
ncbi:MAG: carboxypeptidase-like regulatory domain-containing protein, partial [Pseudomonadota bacterium]|nr:carboxypeptidase-like regulatory domain-containing protein [Pseudomonadota bacterium]